MGWGSPCQACPQPDSEEFEQLCPFGSGKTHSGDGKLKLKCDWNQNETWIIKFWRFYWADINECAQNPNICTNGACENLLGTYRCICNPGYQVDSSGKTCTDINECAVDNLLCDGGQCRNTPGSFQVKKPNLIDLFIIKTLTFSDIAVHLSNWNAIERGHKCLRGRMSRTRHWRICQRPVCQHDRKLSVRMRWWSRTWQYRTCLYW